MFSELLRVSLDILRELSRVSFEMFQTLSVGHCLISPYFDRTFKKTSSFPFPLCHTLLVIQCCSMDFINWQVLTNVRSTVKRARTDGPVGPYWNRTAVVCLGQHPAVTYTPTQPNFSLINIQRLCKTFPQKGPNQQLNGSKYIFRFKHMRIHVKIIICHMIHSQLISRASQTILLNLFFHF